MAQEDENKRDTTSVRLPEEVWHEILKRLKLTDLAIVSQASEAFSSLTESTIKLSRMHDSPFTSRRESAYGLVLVEPVLCVAAGLASFYLERTNELHVLNMATGKTVALLDEFDSSPYALEFSPSGKFIAACYDKCIRVFNIDQEEGKLRVCREVKFDVPLMYYDVPGNEVHSFGTGQMVVSFSKDERTVGLAHISEPEQAATPGEMRRVKFKCLTLSLRSPEDVVVMSFEEMDPSPTTKTFSLEVDQDIAQLCQIDMNVDPFRFYVPPGCLRDHGLLVDPTHPNVVLSTQICEFNRQFGELVHCGFSSCGQYFMEARSELSNQTPKVTLRKIHLNNSICVRLIKIPLATGRQALDVMFSNDGRLAVILQGEVEQSLPTITGWQAVNLYGEGYVTVECKEPICATQGDESSTSFNLSFDGQLISVSCHVRGENECKLVKVFETASGRLIDCLKCSVPNGEYLHFQEFYGARGIDSYHAFGGENQPKLAIYTAGLFGLHISFAHGQ